LYVLLTQMDMGCP